MKPRPSAVAGLFYPREPEVLKDQLETLLAKPGGKFDVAPKALIVPHAGYIYSGSTAAEAFHQLACYANQYTKVVLLGPSHHVAFYGLAVPSVTAFRTPLGDIPLATATLEKLAELPQVITLDGPHAEEHSLEVQLPFLQACLTEFELMPVVVGEASATEVAQVLEVLWGGSETLILASSDLSHFLSYEQAKEKDRHTSSRILSFATNLEGEEACGCRVLNGLLHIARDKDLSIDLLALQNSGDTAGGHSRVVGYGAYALY